MTKLWSLQADFEALDVGTGFFIVKFDMMDDYNRVYTGGPWIVIDHYVTVRKWRQDFKSDDAEEDTIAIWVRFPNLPIEYYNEKVLYHIAKALGVPLKVDINTAMAARGKYARVCVEIDLRKPLVSHFTIGKYTYGVEYEHLHSLCFSCGRVGHRKEICSDCPLSPVETQTQNQIGEETEKLVSQTSKDPSPNQVMAETEVGQSKYRPWMKVINHRRKPKA
ncbi:hypothetical protein ACSBR1_034399 [Camellia fascicularis]